MARNSTRPEGILRRTFLGGMVAAAVPFVWLRRLSAAPASERISMACIGLGGQGRYDLKAFLHDPRVQVVAVCDADLTRAQAAKAAVDAHYGETAVGCALTQDYRELMARADIDTVLVATPDHTHALITIAAARAGKDVYCEKPLAYSVAEGRAVVEAVRRCGRVLQTGTQRRSSAPIRVGCELVRNGYIGDLKLVQVGLPRGFAIRNGEYSGDQPEQAVPPHLDYDKWLGPAPYAPYTPGRCHFNFRWILDYGEGYISDWGAHYLDVAQWGIGADLTGPRQIEASATFPASGLYDAPTDFAITYTYADGIRLECGTDLTLGMRFEGSEGWVHLERPRSPAMSVSDERLRRVALKPGETHLRRSASQHRDFVDCVFSRRQPAAHGEIGHRSASICHIGMIAARLGRNLEWDPAAERFPVAEIAANRLLSRPMRAPWTI